MLIEKVFTLIISGIIIAVLITLLPDFEKSINDVNNDLAIADSTLEMSTAFENVCMQYNTFMYSGNIALRCLAEGTCTSGNSGFFSLIDKEGKLLSSTDPQTIIYYDETLNRCDDCTTYSDPQNYYKLTTHYKLQCGESCTDEPIIEIVANYSSAADTTRATYDPITTDGVQAGGTGAETTANPEINLKPIQLTKTVTVKNVFKSCQDAFDKGYTQSGVYFLDFDGFAGKCPYAFYCKMTSGKPRMLIANAPSSGYTKIPQVPPPVMPNLIGRINDEILSLILHSGSKYYFTVNVNETSQGDLTVHYTTAPGGKGEYLTKTDYCAKNNTSLLTGIYTAKEVWSFRAALSESSVGYTEYLKEGSELMKGFHCLNCGTTIGVCGIAGGGCCQTNLAGEVWLSF